jgi:hypothetical protein
MVGVWIAVGLALLIAAAALARLPAARRRGRARSRAEIVELENATSVDPETEAVTSVQKAELLIDRDALVEIWTPENLERLARTYWRFLTRVTLGLVRIHYSERERYVVLVLPPLRLLTFQAPEYEIDSTRGLVRWRIARGLLVSRRGRNGRGYLQIEVRRRPEEDPAAQRVDLHVEIEVANFYPSIASRLSRRVYNATQSRLHVIITVGFLRSLTRLDLAESRVGLLRAQ